MNRNTKNNNANIYDNKNFTNKLKDAANNVGNFVKEKRTNIERIASNASNNIKNRTDSLKKQENSKI